MPKLLAKLLRNTTEQIEYAARVSKDNELLALIAGHLEVSDKCNVYAATKSMWAVTRTREDLSAVLSLAPQWQKTYPEGAECIRYTASIPHVAADGEEFAYQMEINAYDEALPPTCVLEEYEVAVPATVRKAKRLRCTFAQPPAEPQAGGGTPDENRAEAQQ